MSIDSNNIKKSTESLRKSLTMIPEDGEQMYHVCRDIIDYAIKSRIKYDSDIFLPIIGLESELAEDRGSGLSSKDPIFVSYANSLRGAQARILKEVFGKDSNDQVSN